MTFTLTVEIDNAAFEDGDELVRILRRVALQVEGEGSRFGSPVVCPVRDINGNTVGEWKVEA